MNPRISSQHRSIFVFTRKLFAFAVPITVLLSNFSSLLGKDVVCRRPAIKGYESEYAAAHNVLSSDTTTSLDDCKIYITRQGNDFYAHSNYQSIDSSETRYHRHSDYPTKLVGPASLYRSLDIITNNIAADSEEN